MVKRKLASIVKISDISPIKGADLIEVATWKGWQTVVKKGEFSVGDLVVGIETDSWVPNTLAPFLSHGKEPRTYNDILGERLRTIKLKGQLSQGLILPLSVLPGMVANHPLEGLDVTETLNITKWERPIPAQLAGQMKGNFPDFLRKTDQERVQNIPEDKLAHLLQTNTWQVTEKLDGCVKGTTLLEVKGKGRVHIRQVQVGDYILGYDHDNKTSVWTEVVGVQATKSPQKEWYTLTAGSKTLTLTGNHKIFVVELNKYVAVEDLVNLPNYTDYNLLTF